MLHFLASQDHPVTPSELAERSNVTSARVTNVLNSLESRGAISRKHSETDRRVVEVSITDEGRDLVEKGYRETMALTTSFLTELGEQDSRDLVRVVRDARAILVRRKAEGRGLVGRDVDSGPCHGAGPGDRRADRPAEDGGDVR
ncbi:MAG: MarR family transcriptional regulator [Atopobiaceae bacterium]|jgi:DNA-binding MarR family transcriptional regulator|nr:MarR family transcriptional regulator [Atopobiaceae bacterium]MCI2173333.1 MarR family transcriptional regulator [Atopobiaceae bacterium]MCI2207328.1 MarR family transcriptional regulator [Atopobiaceae bacterium]